MSDPASPSSADTTPASTPTPTPQKSSTTKKAGGKKINKPFQAQQKYLASLKNNKPPPRSFLAQAILWSLLAFVTSALLSKMVTESWTWGNDDHYFKGLRKLKEELKVQMLGMPRPGLRDMSEAELKRFDGSNPNVPLYIAIDGDVYDVSVNRKTYGPGGSYAFFAGVDAARSYVTGCFKTHLTHDLRGFDQKDLDALNHWKSFFAKSDKYPKVGRVMHPPIDPASPIPAPCKQ